MNSPVTNRRARRLLWSAALGAVLLPAMQVWAQPANRPLLTNQSGAKPNLMVALDNSGSMAFTYHESYNITDDNERVYCPSPYSRSSSTNSTTFNNGIGQDANVSAGPVYTCYQRVRISGNWVTQPRTDVAIEVRNWSAQRSADVNPVYYNPRVRYVPRVDGSGAALVPTDNVVWVSNQNSTSFRYTVLQRNLPPNDFRVYHSMYASDGVTRNFQGVVNTLAPTGFTNRYDLDYDTLRIPQHIPYTAATTLTPAFTYAYCSAIVTNGSGMDTGCSARTRVDVRYGDTATYTIPTPNNRSDCTNSVCTNAQEVANILNWYRYYSTRHLATNTAIGLALADTNASGQPNTPAKFDNELRVGYMQTNQNYAGPLTLPPGAGCPGDTVAGREAAQPRLGRQHRPVLLAQRHAAPGGNATAPRGGEGRELLQHGTRRHGKPLANVPGGVQRSRWRFE